MIFNPVLPATAENIGRWVDATTSQRVTDEDKLLIESGGLAGRKRYYELLFGASFLTLDRSFHASLRDYCARIIRRDFDMHQLEALGSFLSFVYPCVPEMIETEFIDIDLAGLLSAPEVAAFVSRSTPSAS